MFGGEPVAVDDPSIPLSIRNLKKNLASGMDNKVATANFINSKPTKTELHQAAKILGCKPGWAFMMWETKVRPMFAKAS